MPSYEDHKALIIARAQSWNFTTGLEIDECISISNLGFAEAVNGFDSEKAKFITYLWPSIDTQFKVYFNANRCWPSIDVTDNIERLAAVNGALRSFRDKVLGVSGRAQMVIDDVLGSPDAYLMQRTKSGYKYPRHLGIVKRVASLGYPWETAKGIVSEITQMLQEV
jgi:hypothetical protein